MVTEKERLNAPSSGYLEHYGVKGQKWGVIRSRDELGYDTIPKKKKPGVVASIRKAQQQKKKAKLKAKAKAEAQKLKEAAKKAAEEAEKRAKEEEATREKLRRVSNKDADFLYKNRHLLDDRELQNAISRINMENSLKKIVDSKPSDFDKAMRAIKKVSGTINDVYSVYNSEGIKAIRRALGDESATPGATQGKKKKKKNRNNSGGNNNSGGSGDDDD